MSNVKIDTTATIPSGASVTIYVWEDTDQDGTVENYASTSITDGSNSNTLSGLTGGTGNDYAVVAEYTPGSAASLDSWTLNTSPAPTTPQNFTATAGGNSPDLSWDAVDWNGDQGHYNVHRAPTVGGSLSQIAEVPSGTTTYDDTGASQDEHYDYTVEAENGSGTSNLSNRDDARTLPNAPSAILAGAFIDNFEDEDLAEYNVSGAGSIYAIDTSSPINGNASLLRTDESGGYEVLISDSSAADPLSNYPTKGDTFEVKIRSQSVDTDYVQSGIVFGAADTANFYAARYEWGADQITLLSRTGGSNSTLGFVSDVSGGVIAAGDIITLEVDWQQSDDIIVTLYNSDKSTQYGSLTANNSDHSTEGVGFRSYVSVSGANLTYDSLEIL